MKVKDIREIAKAGELKNESEHKRALVAYRKLRLLSKEDPSLKAFKKDLFNLIHAYEEKYWSDEGVDGLSQTSNSRRAEIYAEKERKFYEERKQLILKKIKSLNLNQKQFGIILGHNESYTSELINGIRSFSMADLIIIHKLLKIRLRNLVFPLIPPNTEARLIKSVQKVPGVKIKGESLVNE